MPVFAGVVIALFERLSVFFTKYLGTKLAVGMAATGTFATATGALFAALSLILNGLTLALPAWPGMETAIWVAIPPAVPFCISAAVSADLAIVAYRWHVENIRLMTYST